MIETLLQSAGILFDPLNLLVLIGAVVAGAIVGATPGLTSTMAIGLLVPITFTMPQTLAFMLLLGIYCGGIYGGSITAILLNLPGTPTSVITAIDGYAMTRRGEAGRAIAIATVSSTLGGIISCIFLIALSTQLAQLVIYFGAPEYMALGIFASAVVFTLSGESMLKGFVSLCFGFLIASVGIDPTAMHPRFTLGITELLIGVPPVPAIIGLFCVSEVFRMAEDRGLRAPIQRSLSGLRTGLTEFPRLWRTIGKGSAIGCLIGSLPGIGALAASSLSYAEAKRASRRPERFGQGAEEGVSAAESANNAVTGGALVPTLTFGIPGDTNTLLILSALTVQGLVPGPMLFREQSEFIYVIFGALVLANLFILPVGLALSRTIAQAALVPTRFLLPVVAVLAITGASIGYGHIYYFWISIGFGLLGWLMQRAGFPLLPLAMALILGPIVERSLRSSLMLPGAGVWYFLERPLVAGFLVLSLAVFAGRLWAGRRRPASASADKTG